MESSLEKEVRFDADWIEKYCKLVGDSNRIHTREYMHHLKDRDGNAISKQVIVPGLMVVSSFGDMFLERFKEGADFLDVYFGGFLCEEDRARLEIEGDRVSVYVKELDSLNIQKSQNKPHPLGRGKTQGLFDNGNGPDIFCSRGNGSILCKRELQEVDFGETSRFVFAQFPYFSSLANKSNLDGAQEPEHAPDFSQRVLDNHRQVNVPLLFNEREEFGELMGIENKGIRDTLLCLSFASSALLSCVRYPDSGIERELSEKYNGGDLPVYTRMRACFPSRERLLLHPGEPLDFKVVSCKGSGKRDYSFLADCRQGNFPVYNAEMNIMLMPENVLVRGARLSTIENGNSPTN